MLYKVLFFTCGVPNIHSTSSSCPEISKLACGRHGSLLHGLVFLFRRVSSLVARAVHQEVLYKQVFFRTIETFMKRCNSSIETQFAEG